MIQDLLRTLAALMLLGLACWPVMSRGQTEDAPAFEIKAQTLVVDDTSREAHFEGEVVARRGDWVMTCRALNATYDEAGTLTGVVATGPVTLTGPEVWVEAARARYERATDTVTLEGEPTLRRGKSVLKGSQMKVNLSTRRVEVTQAKGRFVPSDQERVP